MKVPVEEEELVAETHEEKAEEYMSQNDGREQERSSANRDAFTGINGELHKISYSIWNNGYIIHNIIVPYEYREHNGKNNAEGNLRVGFIPISDKTDLIDPYCKTVAEGPYMLRKTYIVIQSMKN